MILPYRRYFDFSGRSRRLEYWSFFVGWTVAMVVLGIAAVVAIAGSFQGMMEGATVPWARVGSGMWLLLAALMILFLASLIPMIAVQVRRLHDLGVSGWWYLACIIAGNVVGEVPQGGTYISGLLNLGWLVWMFFPGTSGPNRYGDDPKDPAGVNEVFA